MSSENSHHVVLAANTGLKVGGIVLAVLPIVLAGLSEGLDESLVRAKAHEALDHLDVKIKVKGVDVIDAELQSRLVDDLVVLAVNIFNATR